MYNRVTEARVWRQIRAERMKRAPKIPTNQIKFVEVDPMSEEAYESKEDTVYIASLEHASDWKRRLKKLSEATGARIEMLPSGIWINGHIRAGCYTEAFQYLKKLKRYNRMFSV